MAVQLAISWAASGMARAQPFGPAGVVVVLKPSVLLAWTAKSLVNVLLISREQRAASSEQSERRGRLVSGRPCGGLPETSRVEGAAEVH